MLLNVINRLWKAKTLTEIESSYRLEQHSKQKDESEMQHEINFTTERQTPVPHIGMVTNFTKSGAAFCRIHNTTTDIFVPTSVVERAQIDRGDEVIAMTVPNKLYESWTPELGVMQPAQLFAIHVMRKQDYEEMSQNAASNEVITPPEEPLRPRIKEYLRDGPATAKMISQGLGLKGQQRVFDMLNNMHNDGEVCRASIRRRGTQERDSYTIWALNPMEFLPTFDDDTHHEEEEYGNELNF